MGLFDKIFGKKENIPQLETTQEAISPTAEMLDEDLYWKIIEFSLQQADNQYDQEQVLIREIEKLNQQQMIGFRLRTDKLLYDTYNSEMWCAAYIMNGGCSDDMFEYFRNWVISRGRDVYYAAKENPDSLITEADDETDEFEFETFWYVALEAFKNKTGENLYNHIDNENFETKEGNYPQFDFTWTEEDPESLQKICPKLFERFLGNFE
ncbi:DUF4240 domain-containing protein [Pedobacter miscanthi]|uniref:DUF4240 domain-containing protein n=1 Tax=Pedobacter miscanthi TaxID=2259170 RepID=A0A366L7M2_9SPHI|nr:DUF4240 domain-containing protein [Pedobacter miscanthi]RBQ09885.1 DUF4240 domain-containing protein [Pedobacter miscanthi]